MLNEEQQAVVDSTADRILVLAGAGTGKTHCMLERINHLIDIGVPATSMLVLTFTNAAALEMKTRFMNNQIKFRSIPPEFRTFHAFCYNLLAQDKAILRELGYTSLPSIITDDELNKLHKEIILQLNLHLSVKKLTSGAALSRQDQYELAIFNKAKDKALKQKNVISFDLLCSNVCNLFEINSPLVKAYKERYKYIFVDEFQDTDPVQWDFVRSFIKTANIYVVGDALQAIYSFRNADSTIIKELAHTPSWKCYKLSRNYRSTEPICDYANSYSQMKEASVKLVSDKEGCPVVEKYYLYDAFSKSNVPQLNQMKEWIKTFEGSSAILCRSNREVADLQMWLESENIPYSTKRKSVDTLSVLNSIMDNEYLKNWLATLLPAEEYTTFLKAEKIHQVDDGGYSCETFIKDFAKGDPILVESAQKVFECREILATSTYDARLKFLKLSEKLHIPLPRHHEISNTETNKEIVDSFITMYMNIDSTDSADSADLYVGTIHSVKGLEYDNVIVLNADGESFPIYKGDNLNLFYVAVTRAKSHLYVMWARGEEDEEGRYED